MSQAFVEEIVAEARKDRSAALARVRQLRAWQSERAVELLAALLKAPMGDVRAAAAEALGGSSSDDAVRVLVTVLKKDRDWHVRSAALKALASIGSPAAVEAIKEAQNDKAFGVREDARVILMSLPEQAVARARPSRRTYRRKQTGGERGRK